jgi:hypothetical protein
MDHKKKIMEFVKGVLGCQCPDDVFEQIESHVRDLVGNTRLQTMTTGKRLPIYIWSTNEPSLVRTHLPSMLLTGMKERDQRGLNRFRAVIASDGVEPIGTVAREVFRDFKHKDDKMHLHVVCAHHCPKRSRHAMMDEGFSMQRMTDTKGAV